MPFIQAPRQMNRNPHLVQFIQDYPQCADRALQYGSVGNIERKSTFPQQPSGMSGFFHTRCG